MTLETLGVTLDLCKYMVMGQPNNLIIFNGWKSGHGGSTCVCYHAMLTAVDTVFIRLQASRAVQVATHGIMQCRHISSCTAVWSQTSSIKIAAIPTVVWLKAICITCMFTKDNFCTQLLSKLHAHLHYSIVFIMIKHARENFCCFH